MRSDFGAVEVVTISAILILLGVICYDALVSTPYRKEACEALCLERGETMEWVTGYKTQAKCYCIREDGVVVVPPNAP